MNKSILTITFYTYIFSVFILIFVFKKELTTFILLQNSIFFLCISYLIFRYFAKSNLEEFSLASKVTYMRLSVSIVLLTAAINSSTNSTIFEIFYMERYFIILAIISFLLDGLDGFIARKYNQVTKYGEVIDQEADNFLIFVMSISLYINKEIGLYVFLIPAFRYIFIFSMTRYYWLKNTLPDSQLRKAVCVSIIFIMIISQDSYFANDDVVFLVLLSLFIITFSFSRDIIWLYRNKYEKN